jgi:hypothetical protein
VDHRETRGADLPHGRTQLLLQAHHAAGSGTHLNRSIALLCCALLAGCGDRAPSVLGGGNDVGSELDKAAIAVGIMPDPDEVEFAGRFETRSELGTDKFCAVSSGAKQFDVGFISVFGPESKCEGQGTATINGEKVNITLDGKEKCSFEARYDGIELRFPGSVESGCASYCSPRASLSGTHYFMVQPGNAAARNTLGRDIESLCP